MLGMKALDGTFLDIRHHRLRPRCLLYNGVACRRSLSFIMHIFEIVTAYILLLLATYLNPGARTPFVASATTSRI